MFNKIFNAFILIGMTISMVFITAIKLKNGELTSNESLMIIIAAFGSLMGVLSTVSSANGKILTFIFGFIDVSIYGTMCLMSGNYGNAAIHLLYFVPMQFVGFYQWRKRGAREHKSLQARRLDAKRWTIYGSIFLVGLLITYIILAKVGTTSQESLQVLKWAIIGDAVATMCNIIGQVLMSMAYMEQWIFWLGVNTFSIIMWISKLNSGSDYAILYVVKYCFYFVNALNGLRIWINLSKPAKKAAICN